MERLLPKAISFDIYGTVIDWVAGTIDWYQRFFDKHQITHVSAAEIRSTWEKVMFEYIRNYRPFRQVKVDTFKTVAEYYNFPYTDEEVIGFAEEMSTYDAFPDSLEALKIMKKLGIKTCAVSNVDTDIIQASFKHCGIEMDAIVTAEDVHIYKPHYEPFLKSQEVLGCKASEMHHAAFGFKYDAVPANALGYTTVWIRRRDVLRDAIDKEDLCFGDLKSYATYLMGLKAIDEANGIIY